MIRFSTRAVLISASLALAFLAESNRANAQPPDLFYNYYAAPSAYGGVPAQLYISPRPTPPLVGHTWITYPPLMPHEFLYHHKRTYYRYYPGGFTTTHVRYH